MHELAVTESILSIALDYAERSHAAQVTDIHLVIGRLSSIVDDSVSFYWEIISRDTICSSAALHFTRLPAQLICLDCHTEYEVDQDLIPCPKCNSVKVKVLSGNEFRVESIEITSEEND
ncbi:MAG: hydrogenase maturation nickel metallochaperone HypA [Anaerolinea sp.]|nr:hydrogenase maturation nickel metallochaperone HypA [Anaerolinea sp.]